MGVVVRHRATPNHHPSHPSHLVLSIGVTRKKKLWWLRKSRIFTIESSLFVWKWILWTIIWNTTFFTLTFPLKALLFYMVYHIFRRTQMEPRPRTAKSPVLCWESGTTVISLISGLCICELLQSLWKGYIYNNCLFKLFIIVRIYIYTYIYMKDIYIYVLIIVWTILPVLIR